MLLIAKKMKSPAQKLEKMRVHSSQTDKFNDFNDGKGSKSRGIR